MSEIKKDKCRTCLKMNTKMHSLNTKPKMLEIDKTYKELLKRIAHIEMDPEIECRISQRICSNCSKKIRDSYSFIEQVYKCHQYFVKLEESNALHEVPFIKQGDSFVKFLSEPKENELRIESHDSIAINYNSNIASKLADHPTDTVELPNDNLTTDAKAENVLQEVPSIKQEEIYGEVINGPKEKKSSIESCSSMSTNENSNVASNDTLATDDKAENISKNEQKRLNSECAVNDAEFEDHLSGSSDNDTSSNYSCHEDPLDNEPNEEAVADTLQDEMLPVRCDICERVFSNSLLLNRHKKDTHLPDELKIQCPNCPVKFSRRYNMYAHMRTFHKSETVREHQLQPRKLTKTDVCDQCQRSYSDKYKLMAHIKNKHGPGSLPKKPKQPPKQYLCTLCGLTCTNKSNLEIHYRRRHTGEKPFKCDFCDRCFTRSYEVKVHRRTHTGEAPYKCTVCEKAFKRSNKLKIHMRIHTNERPYKCNECEKAFRESKDLNIHRRTHTGERPYKCSVCQSAFTQSNSLRLHQKNKKHFVDLSHALNIPLL